MALEVKEHRNQGEISQLSSEHIAPSLPLPPAPYFTPSQFYAELTDPSNHDPNLFCYIVHGINPSAKNGLLLAAITQQGYDPNQEIDLLDEPTRIVGKKLISTSIIDQNLRGTWGDVFFILEVPWSNFVSMSPRDAATNVTNPDFVLENARTPQLLPSQLIAQTMFCGGKSAYNEVVITGTARDQKVKIIGVGIKLCDAGDDVLKQPEEATRMREIAKMLNVPVIELVDVVRIQDSQPEINYGYLTANVVRSVYVNQGGYRYCFEASWDDPKIKDAFRGDKNTYGGHNAISKDEYKKLRPALESALKTEAELLFLKQLDQMFAS